MVLALISGAMLSKSLFQISVDGKAVFHDSYFRCQFSHSVMSNSLEFFVTKLQLTIAVIENLLSFCCFQIIYALCLSAVR